MASKRKASFMASRRVKRFKKRSARGARVARARRSRIGVMRSRISGFNQHSFMRWGSRQVNTITGTDQTYSKAFTFNDIVNPGEFDVLYDRYMITKIVFEVQLVNNIDNGKIPNSTADSQSNYFPRMWYCRDYDDSTAETLDELKQRAACKSFVLMPNKIYKIALKPAILGQTYRTLTTTGYSPLWNQWIDMAQKDVPHYGLKWVMDTHNLNPDDTNFFQYDTTVKMYFKCKDVR